MENRNAWRILPSAALAAIAILSGCAAPGGPTGQTLLFDGEHPLKEMYHVTVEADPFGGSGKVLAGGPLGPEEPYANKGSFIKGAGFFVVPEAETVELVLRVGTRKIRNLKIEVWAKDPKGSQKFRPVLPTEGGWHEIVLPLDPDRLKPGCTVHDITVFQVGKDKQARLYIGGVSWRAR